MKKHILFHVALSIVLSIVFVACSPPKPTETVVSTQEETDLPKNSTESKSIEEPAPIEKPAPFEKPKSITKLIPVNKPVPIQKPKPVEKPVPVETPKTIENPVPVAKPVSLKSSMFILKFLKATIKGTSTLHEWESQITQIVGKGSLQEKDKSIAVIQDAEIKIDVKGIKSKEGKKMDNKTYETFKSDEYPFIIYTFSNTVIKINASNVVTIHVEGKLNMAGVSQPVSFSVNGTALPSGDLSLTFSKKIKMTAFNMEPPVMFLGTIKVGDEITVSFDFELTKLKN